MLTRTTKRSESYYPDKDYEHDFIGGTVGEIIDGNTFELYVTEEDPENLHEYQLIEIVKVSSLQTSQTVTRKEVKSMERLEEKLGGQNVVCEVIDRDLEGNLIAIYNLD